MKGDSSESGYFSIPKHSGFWGQHAPEYPSAKNPESLGMLTSLFGAGIYTLFYILNNENFPDYYEDERSHPHPVIRFNAVMLKVISSLQVVFHDNVGIDFDRKGVLRQANQIMRKITNEEVCIKSKKISKNLPQIAAFLFKKQEQFKERRWLAASKLMAKEQKKEN